MISNNNKLPDTTEVENEDGTITRTSFKYKGKEIIKTYKKYKLVKDTIKKSKRVIERNERLKNKKFGNAKGINNNDVTFVDNNECKILMPSEWDDCTDEPDIKKNISLKKSNNNKNQSSYNKQGKYSNNEGSYNKQGKYSNNEGSYNKQGKYSNNEGSYNKQGKDKYNINYYSIRISNISNNITENDLYDLASIFGSIKKITIAKDKDTRKSKGYAFVNFSDKICAKNALDNLNGHGYDNMILNVEYSRNIY